MLNFRSRLRSWLDVPDTPTPAAQASLRARPGQSTDQYLYAWGVSQDVSVTLAFYAYNNWVQTAVSRLASRAASAALNVAYKNDPIKLDEMHGLAQLLGARGTPNDYQDSLEFLEMHFTHVELAGNSFWYWDRTLPGFGPPDMVHILDPRCIKILPGAAQGIAAYEYWVNGQKYKIDPGRMTHFKRTNPYSIYWGLSALEALKIEVKSDNSMAAWNAHFFDEDVAIPAGIVVVPTGTPDAEMDRLDDELHSKHGGKRRTAIVRADAGSTVYLPAGVAPKDLDFANGRLLSRRAVYEALELPLGLMSEASTEAHARVAERQLAEAIAMRHTRTARKLNSDALGFWPAPTLRQVKFEDLSLRAADWDRESKRLAAVRPFMSVNEVRTQILQLPATPGGDEVPGTQKPEMEDPNGQQPGQPDDPGQQQPRAEDRQPDVEPASE